MSTLAIHNRIAMFPPHMAGGTERDQIRGVVGRFMLFHPKLAKRLDVMHVKRSPQLSRADAAVGTDLVPVANNTSGLTPGWPVVGQVAPTPVVIAFSGNSGCEMHVAAVERTEATPGFVAWLDNEVLPALFALLDRRRRQVLGSSIFAPVRWVRRSSLMLRLPISITAMRTEPASRACWLDLKRLTTLLAVGHVGIRGDISQVLDVDLPRTGMRAVLSWPTQVVLKFFAAGRAGRFGPAVRPRSFITRFRTVLQRPTRVVPEVLTTGQTVRLNTRCALSVVARLRAVLLRPLEIRVRESIKRALANGTRSLTIGVGHHLVLAFGQQSFKSFRLDFTTRSTRNGC